MHSSLKAATSRSICSSTEWIWLIFAAVCALIAIATGFILMRGVLASDQGTPTMIEIAKAVQEGAQAYLVRQFRAIGIIVLPAGRPGVLHRQPRHPDPAGRHQAHRPVLRPGGPLPGSGLPGGRHPVGTGRLYRDEHGGARQRPHRGRGP